jgi:hypothetical protein
MNDINNIREKRASYQLKWRAEKQSAESKLKEAWVFQKCSAKRRGIEFLLTFEEWLKVWTDSGHLHERGRRKHEYCMARNGDCGPYAVGNVSITTMEENGRLQTPPFLGRSLSDDHRKQVSQSMMGNTNGRFRRGIKHTEESLAKMRESHRRRRLKPWSAPKIVEIYV